VWGTSSEADNVTWGCSGEDTAPYDDPNVPSVFDGTIFDSLFDQSGTPSGGSTGSSTSSSTLTSTLGSLVTGGGL